MDTPKKFGSIDQYIAGFPPPVQERLEAVRAMILETVPEATEAISYQMPTFQLNGNLIHFAAFKNHIGAYPTPDGIKAFEEELLPYKGAKGSVQFSYNEPLPLGLTRRIVLFRQQKMKGKKKA